MKSIFRWLIFILLIATAAGGYYWYSQREAGTRIEVLRTGQTVQGDLDITVAVSGNVVANQRADIRFSVPGTVESINVTVGQHVKAGQVLAQLDATALERAVERSAIALEQARLRNRQISDPPSEEALRQARNVVSQTAAALNLARLNYTRVMSSSLLNEDLTSAEERFNHLQTQFGMRQLEFEEGKTSDWTRDRAREAADNAYWALVRLRQQADLEKTRANNDVTQAWNTYKEAMDRLTRLEEGASETELESSALDIKAAELALAQAREDLDGTALRAPFDGVVAAVNLQRGVSAPTTSPAVTLIDDTLFFADVTVDETDIGKIQVNQTAEITLDAYANVKLEGEVVTIAPAASSVAGIVAYPVRVQVMPSDGVAIRDGMTASILIRVSQIRDAVLIPNWAIRTDPSSGDLIVFCYCLGENQQPQRVPITLGERNETFTQVLSGLDAGATVVLVTEERANLLDFAGPPSGMR